MYYTYILLCRDLSFYVGYTGDLKQRIIDHNNKQGSFYIQSRLPVKLVYYEKHEIRIDAIKREKQIKNWSKIKKIKLIKFGHPGGKTR